eukprot:1846585-Prymnesium_polylepis.1
MSILSDINPISRSWRSSSPLDLDARGTSHVTTPPCPASSAIPCVDLPPWQARPSDRSARRRLRSRWRRLRPCGAAPCRRRRATRGTARDRATRRSASRCRRRARLPPAAADLPHRPTGRASERPASPGADRCPRSA